MDHIIELKKQRFRFLEKLYEASKGDSDTFFSPTKIFELAALSLEYESGIVNHLEDEGLIKRVVISTGKLRHRRYDSVSITYKGIKEIEEQHFPHHQVIYNIGGNYSETGRVMGDVFKDIQNATVINKSLVENSFNKVKTEHDEETSKALVEVAKFIEKSKNPAAGVLFDSFNQELNKSQPDKSKLKSFWEVLQNALPSIATISDSVAKIVRLFA